MNTPAIKRKTLFFSLVVVSAIGIISTATRDENKKNSSNQDIFSSEINIATPSPSGDEGGLVVPASCPSDLHDAAYYGQPCGACNVCGSCNGGGTYQCGGACSVSAPALTPGYGNTCTSTNACGQSYSAITTCTGAKAAPWTLNPPGWQTSPYTCPPQTITYNTAWGTTACYVEQCTTSNPGAGTIQCDGTCSGAAPPVPANYGTACLSTPNSCGMQGTGIIGCSGSCEAVVPPDAFCSKTLQICENSCSSGIYHANASSFALFDNDPPRNFVACYTDKVNCSDTDPTVNVTASTTWISADTPTNAITLSGTSPKVVTPVLRATPGTNSEDITARYTPSVGFNVDSTIRADVTKFCASGCTAAEAATVCIGKTYTAPSPSASCPGVNSTCDGARNCDYNWIEIAP